MRNIKKIILSALVILCTLAMILPIAATVGIGALTQNSDAYNPDYSNPSSEAVVELTPAEFTELLLGTKISEAEKTYINSMLIGNSLRYSDQISPRCVQTAYDNNTLDITAEVYSYTAANGTIVSWIPKAFVLIGRELSGTFTYDEESGVYTAQVTELEEAENMSIELSYTCTLSVKGEEADVYINYAYRYAKALDAQQKEYENKLASYEEAYKKYQDYLADKEAYDKALIAYNKYLSDKQVYDKKYAEYTKYQADFKIYQEKKALYEAYLAEKEKYATELVAYNEAEQKYFNDRIKYNAEKLKYNAYLDELSVVTDRMVAINSAFAANSQGKMLYATLMGDTVATVVSKKDILMGTAGCDKNDIDTADATTKVLQTLLTEYKKKKTVEAQVAYYQEHYTEIRDNFTELCRALRSLYENDVVRTILKNQGKHERYIEFMIQLYAISTGLDDTQTCDPNLTIATTDHPVTLQDVYHTVNSDLEPIQRPADKNNANPTALVCPARVEEPIEPTFTMPKPTEPAVVQVPIEPDLVKEPTEPTVVEKPTEVAEVPAVSEKDKPIAPTFNDNEKALLSELTNGTLKEREAKETQLQFETMLTKRVSLLNKRHVEFYDYDGKTLLYSQELEIGETIAYPYDDPTRAETQSHTYAFAGWKDEDGNIVGDFGVADDIYKIFYASYTSTIKQYEVTWMVGDVAVTEKYDYGMVPAFGDIPTKETDAQYTYTFNGWRVKGGEGSSNTLPPVVDDITYEATFDSILRYYTITWVWGKYGAYTASESFAYGSMPECKLDISRPEDNKFIYTFKSWDTALTRVVGDETYTAIYTATPIITATGNNSEMVLVTEGDTYKVNVPREGLRVDRLLSLAVLKGKNIQLSADGTKAVMILNEAMITDLAEAGCTDIRLCFDAKNNQKLDVIFSDANGKVLELGTPITLQYCSANEYTKIYSVSSDGTLTQLLASVDGNILSTKLSKSESLLIRNEYAIEIMQIEHGKLFADFEMGYKGQTINLISLLSDEYELSVFKVVGKTSGRTYAVAADGGFVMPAEPVTVTAEIKLREFTVKFVVEGVVVSEKVYHMGDKVEVPADPQKEGNGDNVYTFSGWTPTVTSVSADVTYTAVFTETVKSDLNFYLPSDSKNREYILYLEIAAALLVLAGLIATPIVLAKRRKKRKLNAKQNGKAKNK